jgi:hypothetical protein
MSLKIQPNDQGEYHTAIPSATKAEARTTYENCEEEAIRIPAVFNAMAFSCFWMKRPRMWLQQVKTRRSFSESL